MNTVLLNALVKLGKEENINTLTQRNFKEIARKVAVEDVRGARFMGVEADTLFIAYRAGFKTFYIGE